MLENGKSLSGCLILHKQKPSVRFDKVKMCLDISNLDNQDGVGYICRINNSRGITIFPRLHIFVKHRSHGEDMFIHG